MNVKLVKAKLIAVSFKLKKRRLGLSFLFEASNGEPWSKFIYLPQPEESIDLIKNATYELGIREQLSTHKDLHNLKEAIIEQKFDFTSDYQLQIQTKDFGEEVIWFKQHLDSETIDKFLSVF